MDSDSEASPTCSAALHVGIATSPIEAISDDVLFFKQALNINYQIKYCSS